MALEGNITSVSLFAGKPAEASMLVVGRDESGYVHPSLTAFARRCQF
jgi:hypothetical protein